MKALLHTWRPLVLAAILAIGLANHASASMLKERSLRDLINSSDLIVVGRVNSIDSNAGMAANEPLTKVSVGVERVLRGDPAAAGTDFAFLQRGGNRRDGLVETWSSNPPLIEGDRYILFLQADYYISPILEDEGAVLRVIQVDGEDAVVDSGGRLIAASSTHGLLKGQALADSLETRAANVRADRADASVGAKAMALPNASRASAVFSLIDRLARASTPSRSLRTEKRPRPWPVAELGAPAPLGGTPSRRSDADSEAEDDRSTTSAPESDHD